MSGQTKVLWKATGSEEDINDYVEQNTTHDVLSNQNKETKSSLGENGVFYNREEEMRKYMKYSLTIFFYPSRWLESQHSLQV